MNPDAYREHRYLHNTVYDWCVASLQIPGLEPDRRARIEEIHREVSSRACSTLPHDRDRIGRQIRIAMQELAWLQADSRVDISKAH
jgi:hypothetical protein